MNISKWNGYFREALSPKAIKEQFKPGSILSKLFLFAFVGAIAIGVIYSFVMNNLVGTRASSELISATTAASKQNVALQEEFTVNVLLASTGKKVSQLDLRMKFPTGGTNGDVSYTPGGYESAAVGSTQTNYFDTLVLEEVTGTGADKMLRLVLSARKPEAELSDKVLVKVKFKGTANGKVKFTLDSQNMEIVGPGGGGAEPVSYSIGVGSVESTEVTIGTVSDTPVVQPSNTGVPPSPTTAPTSTTAPGGPSPTTAPSYTPVPTNTTGPTAKPSPTQTTDTKPTPTITIAPPPVCVAQ